MRNRNYSSDDSGFRIGGRARNSQAIIGGFIIAIGIIVLLRRMGAPIPHWILGWETILIAVGIIMGIRSGFREISWLIPIIIGTIFLSGDIFPHLHIGKMIWPLGIIAVGLIIVLKGNKKAFRSYTSLYDSGLGYAPEKESFESGFKRIDEPDAPIGTTETVPPFADNDPNDEIECTAIFGGVKRSVVSKNFRGGEIVAVFGGAEIDLTHADINGVVKLEATNIFGGTKLIVPPNWDVQSEMVAIFGGVEDKRRIQPELINKKKRLILFGTAFMGGLEIRSF